MDTYIRFIIGSFLGAVLNAIGWYGWCVLFIFVLTSKFDLAGGYGGNFVIAFIGGIIGAVSGAVTGIFQPKQSIALIVSGAIALICFLPIAMSFLSGDLAEELLAKKDYLRLALEFTGFAGVFVISVLVVWIVAGIVPRIMKYND